MPEALDRGNTLRRRRHGRFGASVHWVGRPEAWLLRQREAGSAVVGVELTDEWVRLADPEPACCRTVVVLGHEQTGSRPEGLELLDTCIEIPMVDTGASLNVVPRPTAAGSLVLYRLAGLLRGCASGGSDAQVRVDSSGCPHDVVAGLRDRNC